MLNLKGKPMTTAEAVQGLATIFANAEDASMKIKADFRRARKLLEVIRDEGHCGALECQEIACEMDQLATSFDADLWSLHRDLTLRAQARDIDLPALRDGGGGR